MTSLILALLVSANMALAQADAPRVSDHLELTNDHLEATNSGGHVVAGTVNNLNDKICDVTINVNVYGTSHTFLRNRVVRRNALEPSNSWNFRIPAGPEAETYEIISVKAHWYQDNPGAY